MDEIKGTKYKLAGISVCQKGTLTDVFAKFCGVNEKVEDLMTAQPKAPSTAKPGTLGAALEGLEPIARIHTLPQLSLQDIVEAIAGKSDLQPSSGGTLRLSDNPAPVIADLGSEKLAQVLVAMGEARKTFLGEWHSDFFPATPAKKPSRQ